MERRKETELKKLENEERENEKTDEGLAAASLASLNLLLVFPVDDNRR